VNVLFVLDKRVNAGSIQTVANYIRAADEMGHTMAMYGRSDPSFHSIRFSTSPDLFDYVVFISESGLQRLRRLELAHILSTVPWERRFILDTDGMFNQSIVVDGYDRNHPSEDARATWLAYHGALADRVLQTTAKPREPGVTPLLFFGYDPGLEVRAGTGPRKPYDIVHVGHNWWRWREVSGTLLPAVARIRDRLGDICFVGSWWDAAPSWAGELDLKAAFTVDPEVFRRLRIQVRPPVPYTRVLRTMSEGRINVMTQRPLLRHLRILTLKYFEIFGADTIPFVMLDPDDAESVYGPAGRQLALNDDIGARLLDALSRPQKYVDLVQEVRRHLAVHHSYRKRVEELMAALRAGTPTRPVEGCHGL